MYTQTSFPKSLVRSPQNPTVIILITELSILSFGQELLAKFSLLYAKFFAHVNRTVNANILHEMRVVRDQQHRTLEILHSLRKRGQMTKIDMIRGFVEYQNGRLLKIKTGERKEGFLAFT
mmetsp:Transcript_54656/g.80179  ORF Transcript_54656/g.80179 Transcript_54656/m.80179 type:complete len:120 (-) Transcript_54656:27-386(-)